ncbi:MAG: Holliday junction resolvase RuvX [Ignavibacteria bacterium]|nr:Holliday junction resolvase RuvX [Ignavibacteria bacterium]
MTGSGRILGIDFGTKRIGVAISDPLNIIARGVTVIENSPRLFDELKNIVREFEPKKIVVGMPYTLKGEKGVKAQEVDKFIAQLENALEIEVIRHDERFTSEQAHQTLREMGVTKKKRQNKGTIDTMAAALILQRYLDGLQAA